MIEQKERTDFQRGQKWKVRKDGDTRRTAEILHLGQQRLRI